MLLQISYSEEYDPFNATWRLIRYIKPEVKENYKYPINLWCLDEVQIAFEDPLASEILECLWLTIDSPTSLCGLCEYFTQAQ